MLWLIELHGHTEREEKENFSPLICRQEPLPYSFRESCYGDPDKSFGTPSPWGPADPNSVRQRACFHPSLFSQFAHFFVFGVQACVKRPCGRKASLGLGSFFFPKVNDRIMIIITEILRTRTPDRAPLFCLIAKSHFPGRLPYDPFLEKTLCPKVCGHLTRMLLFLLPQSWEQPVIKDVFAFFVWFLDTYTDLPLAFSQTRTGASINQSWGI